MSVGDNPDCSPYLTCLPRQEDAISDGIGFYSQVVIVRLANAIKCHSATIQCRPAGTEEARRCSTQEWSETAGNGDPAEPSLTIYVLFHADPGAVSTTIRCGSLHQTFEDHVRIVGKHTGNTSIGFGCCAYFLPQSLFFPVRELSIRK